MPRLHVQIFSPAAEPSRLLPLLILLLLLAGCATGAAERRAEPPRSFGQVVLYLSLPPASESEVSFDLTAVDAKPAEGDWRRLMTGPFLLDSEQMRGQQILLVERTLPAGQYSGLRLSVRGGNVKRKGKLVSLADPEGGYVDYPFSFRVQPGQVTSLLLNWYPANSVVDGYLLRPALSPQTAGAAARSLEVYVTNEGSNTVSVIDRQTGEVVRTIGVGAAPRGIAYGRFEARNKIFVANSGDNTVSVIDPVANQVEQTIPIRFGAGPQDVVAMAGEFRGGAVYVANYGSQNVSVIDPILYREVDRVQVGRGPVALAVDPPLDAVSDTRGLSFSDLNLWRTYRQSYFHVYVANKLSNTVSVVVCRATDGRPERSIELKVEFSPTGLAVDGNRGKVYVVNHGSNNLSVIDIIQVIRGAEAGAVSSIPGVGVSGMAVVPDSVFERLYLLRENPPEIEFVHLATNVVRGATVPVVGAVSVGQGPSRMVLDPEGRKLYVTCQGSDSLNVVDKTSRKVEQTVEVGHRPYAVAIIP
jgi:YVTN family beta-propeller protein